MSRALHRRLAWVAGAVAVLWAATGFLHPIMSWTAPRPAVQSPPIHAVGLDGLAPPGAMLAAQDVDTVSAVRLIEAEGRRVWLATAPGRSARIAVDAETGALAPDAERALAIALARAFARTDAPVAFAEVRDRFSNAYPSVNRILPIWEVRFATPDGLSLYVDPGADRLVTTSNTLRRTLLLVFQNVHALRFLEAWPLARQAIITVLIGTLLATTLFGIVLSFSAKGKAMRRVHRWLAFAAAPFVLTFASSGLFHLLAAERAAPITPAAFSAADLSATPRLFGAPVANLIATANSEGGAIWRAAAQDGAGLYFGADGALLALTDAERARNIARLGTEADVAQINAFSAEYGFVNKRLPVTRVAAGGRVVFVDVSEGVIAARAPSPLGRFEAWVFDTIHKWSFADPIGKRNRDMLMMLAAATIIAAAGAGLALRRHIGSRS
jgi:hypothetical protein